VAQQAGVGAFRLSKSLSLLGVGDIVNLVSSRAKQNSVHDAGHVTGNAPAAYRVDTVMSMGGYRSAVLKSRMAVCAHQVRLVMLL
jgi:hypothetical protein